MLIQHLKREKNLNIKEYNNNLETKQLSEEHLLF